MKRIIAAVAAALFAAAAHADEGKADPMAPFAALDGKTWRGEWQDGDGSTVVDIARYDLILGGRAIESSHRIEGSTYGGKTIIFYDRAAKKYVFHYFTTAGFHTLGEATIDDGRFVSVETVNGHETIASVKSLATFGADEIKVDVVYLDKDGAEAGGATRIYKPVDHPGPSFDDAP